MNYTNSDMFDIFKNNYKKINFMIKLFNIEFKEILLTNHMEFINLKILIF